MQDTFKCTPELLCEFFDSLPRDSSVRNFFQQWDNFKSSKSPKKEWEIVEVMGNGRKYTLVKSWMSQGYTHPVFEDAQAGSLLGSIYVLDGRNGCTIHSVRRLSDQAIFTKNEVVGTPSDGQHHIGGFEIRGNAMYAQFSVGQILIEHLQKLPQAILTTVDQKEVKEGDLVFYVNSDNFISDIWVTQDSFGDDKNPCNVFSTREAAEEYILNNRPLLSLNDVKEKLSEWVAPGLVKFVIGSLTALVKQKLNQ